MTTTDSSPPLVVRGPAGLLATIPTTLGFHPRDSLVQVCLAGTRDRVGPMGRVDLEPPVGHSRTDYQAGVIDTLLTVARRHAERIVLVWYRDGAGRRPSLVSALSRALARAGIPVIDVVRVGDGRYHSQRHGDGIDPWSRPPADQTASEHPDVGRMRAAAAMRGRTVLQDREGLRRSIAGPSPGPQLTAAQEAFRRRAATAPPGLTDYRAVLEKALAECERRGDLPVDLCAEVVQGLDDSTLCEYVVAQAVGDRSRPWSALLGACARATPDRHAGDLCALLALVCYCEGDGALAQVAVDRSLECRSGHSMARLMMQVMAAGIDPDVVAGHFRDAGLGA